MRRSTRGPAVTGSGQHAHPLRVRLRRWLSGPRRRKVLRYLAGSLVATVASHLTFLVVYALGWGPRLASVLGFVAGFVPNYQLNRRWTWQREGRSSWRREVLPYVGVVLSALVVVTLGTEWAEARIITLGLPRQVEVVAVTVAFAAVNGAMFVGKYLVYDRWLFNSGDSPSGRSGGDGSRRRDRSRSQVPTSTQP